MSVPLPADDPLGKPAAAAAPGAGGMDDARRSALRFFRFLGRRWWVLLLVTAGLTYGVKRYADSLPRTYACSPVVIELVQDAPPNVRSLDAYEYATATMAYTVVPTQQAVLSTAEVLGPVVEQLALSKDPAYLPLAGHVVTTNATSTSLIYLTVQGPRPETNARIANAIAATYERVRTTERAKFLDDLVAQSDGKLKSRREEVTKAQAAIQAWREKNRVVNVDADAETARARVSGLFPMLKSLQAENDKAAQAAEQVRAAEAAGRDLGDVAAVREDPGVRAAFGEYNRLDEQVRRLELSLPAETKDATLALTRDLREKKKAELEGLKATRAEEIRIVAQHASTNLAALSDANQKQEGELDRLVGLSVEYAGLKTAEEQAQQDLASAQKESLEYADLKSRQKAPVKIRQPAGVSDAVVAPKLSIIYAGGGILAFLIALALALLLDLTSTRLRDPEEIQRIAGAPFLGVVPLFKPKKGQASPSRLVLEEIDGDASEAYRILAATALLHSGTGEPPKALLVTSPHAGDGKTTTAVGLAVALARRGGRVLLVDGDLRKPDLHNVLADAPEPGLTTIFAPGRSAWDATRTVEIVVEGHDTVRFDVLTAGILPPNPADLLSGPRMQNFLREARTRYDAVVIDSPPINLVSDACLLAPYVDGLVFVIRDRKTHRGPFNRAVSRVRAVRGVLRGVLVNAVRTRPGGGYGYGYAYGYGYGYGRKQGQGPAYGRAERLEAAKASGAGSQPAANGAAGSAPAANGTAKNGTGKGGHGGGPAVIVRVLPATGTTGKAPAPRSPGG